MRRLAVTMVMLALLLAAGSTLAAQVTLDPAAPPQARLAFTAQSGNAYQFTWSAGEATLELNNNNPVLLFDGDRITYDEETGFPTAYGLVRLPWNRDARLEIIGGEVVRMTSMADVSQPMTLSDAPQDAEWAVLGDAGIFRDITVAPLMVNPVHTDANGDQWVATNLDVRVVVDGELDGDPVPPQRPISRDFWPVYEKHVLNDLDDLGTRLSTKRGSYVIMGSPIYLSQIGDYIEWKQQQGFHVVLHEYETTPQWSDMAADVANYYETLEPQLDFVLLLGDENRGVVRLPAETIQNPAFLQEPPDATDWPLTFMEGDDYFPEFCVGRMPVGSHIEAMSAVNRVIQYESDPHRVDKTDLERWLHGTLVGGNYSESGAPPLTPLATLQWLRNRMLVDWGYTQVDTLFWRNGNSNNPTQPDINNAINQGPLFVAYRGWGDSDGWIAPGYNSNNVEQLTNAWAFPVVGSFVCNTGDFANDVNPTCFSTKWITAGTASQPVGAVSVMAPTDLHTQTKYNNPLIAGAFTSLFDHGMTNLSHMLFAGKMEIYNGHPTRIGSGDMVEFYHHVYHIIGDPTLQVWPRRPLEMYASQLPGSLPYGQNHLDVHMADYETNWGVKAAYVQLVQRQDGELVQIDGGWTDNVGNYSLDLAAVLPGQVELVATRPHYEPFIDTLNIYNVPSNVGVDTWTWDSGGDLTFFVGETVSLTITLANTGDNEAADVSATLSNMAEGLVTINTPTVEYGTIASGESATNDTPFEFVLDEPLSNAMELEFDVSITSGDNTYSGKIWIPISAVRMEYEGYEVTSGAYQPNSIADLTFTFTNEGAVSANGVVATLTSWHEAVTVDNPTVTVGNVAAGQTVTAQDAFTMSIADGVYGGSLVTYIVTFTSDDGELPGESCVIPLEGASSTDPLGPDAHGYFAYDNTDAGFENAADVVPTYTWYDLANDGDATLHNLRDDENFYIELPFDFTFYGEVYEQGHNMTISSNGWVSLEEEPNYTRLNFRNWHLPSALGPQTVIAPLWDDLKPRTNEFTEVYTKYDDANGLFIVEYHTHNRYGLPQLEYPEVFALVLKDVADGTTPTNDDIIEVHYQTVNNVDSQNNFATVGIENHLHTQGLEYTYALTYPDAAAPLEDGRAIRFTTQRPSNFNPSGPKEEETLPTIFALYGVYPNPFNAATQVRFDLPEAATVKMTVYNVMGQQVARLADRRMQPGAHSVNWNLGHYGLSSGIYFLRLEAGMHSGMARLVYMK